MSAPGRRTRDPNPNPKITVGLRPGLTLDHHHGPGHGEHDPRENIQSLTLPQSRLFTHEDDDPIRFFIQQGLPESITGPLTEEIEVRASHARL
jgi:hypothetical protein